MPRRLRAPEGEVYAAVEAPNEAAPAYRRLLGEDAVVPEGAGLRLRIGSDAFIDVITVRECGNRYPPEFLDPPPEYPCLVAVTIGIEDPDRARRSLSAGGIPWIGGPDGRILTDPAAACGAILEFIQGA